MIGIVAGAAIALTFSAWVVWAGVLTPEATMEWRDISYSAVTDGSIEVRYELSVPPGASASCAVQALGADFGIVGWKVVDIPASTTQTRQFAESLRTTQRPVTGLISRCWLT